MRPEFARVSEAQVAAYLLQIAKSHAWRLSRSHR